MTISEAVESVERDFAARMKGAEVLFRVKEYTPDGNEHCVSVFRGWKMPPGLEDCKIRYAFVRYCNYLYDSSKAPLWRGDPSLSVEVWLE